MARTAEDIAPPVDAPEGTCEPVRDHAPWWFVRGSQGWYVVNADTGDCDCLSYVWRCSRDAGSLCKHGRRLREHLEALNACPVCHGRGFLVPSGVVRYVNPDGTRDTGPWACIACSGSGRREETP